MIACNQALMYCYMQINIWHLRIWSSNLWGQRVEKALRWSTGFGQENSIGAKPNRCEIRTCSISLETSLLFLLGTWTRKIQVATGSSFRLWYEAGMHVWCFGHAGLLVKIWRWRPRTAECLPCFHPLKSNYPWLCKSVCSADETAGETKTSHTSLEPQDNALAQKSRTRWTSQDSWRLWLKCYLENLEVAKEQQVETASTTMASHDFKVPTCPMEDWDPLGDLQKSYFPIVRHLSP